MDYRNKLRNSLWFRIAPITYTDHEYQKVRKRYRRQTEATNPAPSPTDLMVLKSDLDETITQISHELLRYFSDRYRKKAARHFIALPSLKHEDGYWIETYDGDVALSVKGVSYIRSQLSDMTVRILSIVFGAVGMVTGLAALAAQLFKP